MAEDPWPKCRDGAGMATESFMCISGSGVCSRVQAAWSGRSRRSQGVSPQPLWAAERIQLALQSGWEREAHARRCSQPVSGNKLNQEQRRAVNVWSLLLPLLLSASCLQKQPLQRVNGCFLSSPTSRLNSLGELYLVSYKGGFGDIEFPLSQVDKWQSGRKYLHIFTKKANKYMFEAILRWKSFCPWDWHKKIENSCLWCLKEIVIFTYYWWKYKQIQTF